MELDIYGFKADVTISDGSYSGVVEELHVITQAKSLKQLKERLEEAVELTIDVIVRNPSEAKHYPQSLLKKIGVKDLCIDGLDILK